MSIKITPARRSDVADVLRFITELARFEKLEHEVAATEDGLRDALFGPHRCAEVVFVEADGVRAGFALFFPKFSTFLGKPGIYLEDLYVSPEFRGRGLGRALLAYLAKLALERNCGRLEWSVLDWNVEAIKFYDSIGAVAMPEWQLQRMSGDALKTLAAT